MTLLIVAILLVLVSLFQPLASRLRLPHTVLLAGLGIGLGLVSQFTVFDVGLGLAGSLIAALGGFDIGAQAIIFLFLPILLFAAGLTVDVRRLLDDIAPVLLLAVVAVLVCTFMVGWALAAVSGQPLLVCLMLGAIVATTDPVAVIGIFREVGAPRRLSILVEGESLLNDAAAIALFAVLLTGIVTAQDLSVLDGLQRFLRAFLGGLVVGLIGSRLAFWILKPLWERPLAEITVTLGLAYLVFIVAERFLQVSGVVAVVTAALVVGSAGRVRLSPQSWRQLVQVWGQLDFWASSLIFLFASMLIPEFLGTAGWGHAGLVLVVVAAALAARAVVLYGLLPAMTLAGWSQRVGGAYKAVILWGGLRGAVTLALALAVTESVLLPREIKEFVAILATGYVLFTLLVNGPTLRPLMRLLKLDRLSPVDEALRNRAIALVLSNVAERIPGTARAYHLPADLAAEVVDRYRGRKAEADRAQAADLDPEQQLALGLQALANREEELYLVHIDDQTVSRRLGSRLVAKAGRLRDGAKVKGRDGYLTAAQDTRRFRWSLRLAMATHRLLRIQEPLADKLADRFEMLLITRIVLEELSAFTRTKLTQLMGADLCGQLEGILHLRLGNVRQALDELRFQYPGYAEALQGRFLKRAALRMEGAEYRTLVAESVISQEIFDDLNRQLYIDWRGTSRRPPLDLGFSTAELFFRYPKFEALSEENLQAVRSLLRPRLAVPGQRLIREGSRSDAMFFISSGAVEVQHRKHGTIRLGSGDFFGEMALRERRRRSATVRAVSYCQLLELHGRDYRRFARTHPQLYALIEEVATERRTGGSVVSAPGAGVPAATEPVSA